MTDDQLIAAAKKIDTPHGKISLIHTRDDGTEVPTFVAKQFAAAIAAQLAAPAPSDDEDKRIAELEAQLLAANKRYDFLLNMAVCATAPDDAAAPAPSDWPTCAKIGCLGPAARDSLFCLAHRDE